MIKTRAIILHRYAYSDSSWIVKTLTENSGVISFIVKGGKRNVSPFKGALDPLSLSEIVFKQKTNTDLQFIKEACLLDWRFNLRENLLTIAKAQVMAEMILRYAPQGVPLESEFRLLEQAIHELNQIKSTAIEQTPASIIVCTPKNNIFAKWLLDTCEIWGYSLDLGTCCRCGNTLEHAAADFFPETGGFVCKSCLGVERPRAKIETVNGLWDLHCTKEIKHPQFVENALLVYLRSHIGFVKELHSLKFLNETRKLFEG